MSAFGRAREVLRERSPTRTTSPYFLKSPGRTFMEFPVIFSIIHGSDVTLYSGGPGIFDRGPVKARMRMRHHLRISSPIPNHSNNDTYAFILFFGVEVTIDSNMCMNAWFKKESDIQDVGDAVD